MGVKIFRPRSPGRRAMTGFDFAEITKTKPEKRLTAHLHRVASNPTTVARRFGKKGGGHKRHYPYDRLLRSSNRKSRPTLQLSSTIRIARAGSRFSIIKTAKNVTSSPISLKVSDQVIAGEAVDIKPGNNLPLGSFRWERSFTILKCVPVRADSWRVAPVPKRPWSPKMGQYCQVKMPSGEVRQILSVCRATVGQVGNTDNENISLGKAGRLCTR